MSFVVGVILSAVSFGLGVWLGLNIGARAGAEVIKDALASGKLVKGAN